MGCLPSWKDKVTLVTGASRGIGRLIALRAAREGARVILVARDSERLSCVEREIKESGGAAECIVCDVADRTGVNVISHTILQQYGAVDVLVNNAGYGGHQRFDEWDLSDIEKMLRVNLLGTIYWTKALLPRMIEKGSGWIVFIASVAGKIGIPDESVYCASKFAMVGLAESLSIEVEDSGVHVLTVCPGAVDTDFFTDAMLARMPAVAKKSMIRPEHVVDGVMKGLAKGKRSVTVPGSIGVSYVVQALFPGFMRRMVKRVALRDS